MMMMTNKKEDSSSSKISNHLNLQKFYPSRSGIDQYQIKPSSSDFGKRTLEVYDPNGKKIWKTVRELINDEVVESLIDDSEQVHWTIHRPIRGWYLILRSPLYSDPQTYISLKPSNSLKSTNRDEQDKFSIHLRSIHIPPPLPTESQSDHIIINSNQDDQNHFNFINNNFENQSSSFSNSFNRKRSSSSLTKKRNDEDEDENHVIKNRKPSISLGTPSPTKQLNNSTFLSITNNNFDCSDKGLGNRSLAGSGSDHDRRSFDLRIRDLTIILRRSSSDPDQNSSSILRTFKSFFSDNDRSFVCFVKSNNSQSNSNLTNLIIDKSKTEYERKKTRKIDDDDDDDDGLGEKNDDDDGEEGDEEEKSREMRRITKVLMEFEDKPSMFGLNNDGNLNLNLESVTKLGMPISFWIATCLAYLGFRDDKEAYLAATEDTS